MGRRGALGRPLLTRRTTRGTPSGPRAGRREGRSTTPPQRSHAARHARTRPPFSWSRRRRFRWIQPNAEDDRVHLPQKPSHRGEAWKDFCGRRSVLAPFNARALPVYRATPRTPRPLLLRSLTHKRIRYRRIAQATTEARPEKSKRGLQEYSQRFRAHWLHSTSMQLCSRKLKRIDATRASHDARHEQTS